MKKNFVSILITNYNKGNYLKKTINSCLIQDYKDKVPQHVQEKDSKKLDDLKVKIIDVQNSLETLTRLVK